MNAGGGWEHKGREHRLIDLPVLRWMVKYRVVLNLKNLARMF